MKDILAVRLDRLGDAFVCVPALEGLRRAHPEARFHVVCSARNAGVFAPERVRTLTHGSVDFAQRLSEARYDAAIVFTEEVAGYAIARASKARRRIGFWHRWQKPLKSLWQRSQLTDSVYRPAAWVERPEHEVESAYRLALVLGAAAPPPADAQSLRAWLSIDGAVPAERHDVIGIQMTAKLAGGGWGPAALARAIGAAMSHSRAERCTLICSVADERLARATMEHVARAQAFPGPVGVIVTSTVPLWLAALASVSALITADTGAAHAAGMLGIPVIDLFEADRFDQLTRRWRPWAAPWRCLRKPQWRAHGEESLGIEIGDALAELRS